MDGYPLLEVAKKIIHAYKKMCEPLLNKFDIPQLSFDIIMFLHNNPEYSTAQDISNIHHIKKNLISVHVEKLVRAGFLQRNSVEGDRRKIALSCTNKAKPIIESGTKLQTHFIGRLISGISEDKWIVFNEIQTALETNAEIIEKENYS